MEEKKSLDTLQKIGGILLIVISVFGVVVPVIGFSYDYGYMLVFNIDSNIFPRSLWDLWKHSITVILEWLKTVPFLLIGFAFMALTFIISLMFFLAAMQALGRKFILRLARRTEAYFEKQLWALKDFYTGGRAYLKSLLITGLSVLSILGFVYVFVLIPLDYGLNAGLMDKNDYDKSGCIRDGFIKYWSRCVDYANPNDPNAKAYSGLLVAASSTHIAIFDNNLINVIPRSPEYVLTRTYKVGTDDTNR
jgi:hypothetical protein